MTTGAAVSRSAAVNARPVTIGTPMAPKYPGVTMLSSALGRRELSVTSAPRSTNVERFCAFELLAGNSLANATARTDPLPDKRSTRSSVKRWLAAWVACLGEVRSHQSVHECL